MKKYLYALVLGLIASTSVFASNNTRTDLLTTTLGYDIIKQGEKLENDPTDIKETDIDKFRYVCQEPSFKRNIKRNTKDFQEQVHKICGMVVSLGT